MEMGPQGADANTWLALMSLREGTDAGYEDVVQPAKCKQLLHYLQEQNVDPYKWSDDENNRTKKQEI